MSVVAHTVVVSTHGVEFTLDVFQLSLKFSDLLLVLILLTRLCHICGRIKLVLPAAISRFASLFHNVFLADARFDFSGSHASNDFFQILSRSHF